jgi:uncharacterized protein (DUF433 family)
MTTEAKIINRGRGPEIAGTRITVYNVLDYLEDGWSHDRIAGLFQLTVEQVRVAVDYIDAHRAEVMPAYQRILERDARGNPPELQPKLDAAKKKLQAMIRAKRDANSKGHIHAGDSA